MIQVAVLLRGETGTWEAPRHTFFVNKILMWYSWREPWRAERLVDSPLPGAYDHCRPTLQGKRRVRSYLVCQIKAYIKLMSHFRE